jgi:hypothetical protein
MRMKCPEWSTYRDGECKWSPGKWQVAAAGYGVPFGVIKKYVELESGDC